ncbi:hypothetical protein EX30DRAFT_366555 [Ascodesmis nigricans]|uniref:Cell surface protein n=1 Tax=Ascodesmis nigricans TaxID=341454 RepID=A0A4S2MRI1_9PEZI|nr:hypothetical protein EX30DRAFT_366555 [Ascodesmis nigricans]
MSGVINKLTGNTKNTAATSTTAGPHDSNIANKMDPRVDSDLDGSRNAGLRADHNYGQRTAGPHSSNVGNKMDPRVDSDLDGSRNMGGLGGVGAPTTGTRHAGTTGYGSTNAGPHSSNAGNKLDPRIDSDLDHRGTTTAGAIGSSHTAGSTNAGPHKSNIANKLDPRVDSDRDGRAAAGNTHGGVLGTGTSAAHTAGSTNYGPHSSNIGNKLDPRVDSDLDRSHGMETAGTMGTTGTTSTTGPTRTTGITAGGTALNSGTYGGSTNAGPHSSNIGNKLDPRVDSDLDGRGTRHTAGSTNYGPHSSNVGNKVDPRVDSDRDGRAAYGAAGAGAGAGAGTVGAGALGSKTGPTTTHGPHVTNTGNKLDPRVDSDRDHRGSRAATATGPAPNTAGPHKSDILNKLDPRVDSDLDGSKTIGNKH